MGKRAEKPWRDYKRNVKQSRKKGGSKTMKKRMADLRNRRQFHNEDEQVPEGIANENIADVNNGAAQWPKIGKTWPK